MKYRRPSRKAEVSTLKEAIDSLLETYRIKGKYNEAQIINAWEKLMGAPIVSQTVSVFVKTDILYVKLSSAALKSE
ncbi:MAG: DciA family protein, partial [Bacteroidota bacterium]